jgi:hypothetical protein
MQRALISKILVKKENPGLSGGHLEQELLQICAAPKLIAAFSVARE